jgi:hypothetical protein
LGGKCDVAVRTLRSVFTTEDTENCNNETAEGAEGAEDDGTTEQRKPRLKRKMQTAADTSGTAADDFGNPELRRM